MMANVPKDWVFMTKLITISLHLPSSPIIKGANTPPTRTPTQNGLVVAMQ